MFTLKIQYNPYRVQTNIWIDDEQLSTGNDLYKICAGQRLQIWIDNFLQKIIEQRRDKDIHISFYGMALDGEDVKDAAAQLEKKDSELHFDIEIISQKNAGKRVQELRHLYEEGLRGPFKEQFSSTKMKSAFDEAMGQIFSVNIVATMSSGKSTVVNALLGRELMPAANEATTATITKIIDQDDLNDFYGQCFDADQKPLSEPKTLITYKKMEEWNNNEKVSKIEMRGNIPTISQADNMTMAIVDTPGPNNSRNSAHRETLLREIQSRPLSMILYVLDGGHLSSTDDKWLLLQVRDAMSRGGRQAQDRFIFIANKFDMFDPQKESIPNALQHIKDYLRDNGIEKPLVIPVSALTALLCRMEKSGYMLTDSQDGNLYCLKKKFKGHADMNMLNHVQKDISPISYSRLEQKLEAVTAANDIDARIEILTGIPIVEELLNDFLQKHAMPAKLKDAVDSFKSVLEMETTLKLMNEQFAKSSEELQQSVDSLNAFLQSAERLEKADEFRATVKAMEYTISSETQDDIDNLAALPETFVSDLIRRMSGENIKPAEARSLMKEALTKHSELAGQIIVTLEHALEHEYYAVLNKLRDDYETFAREAIGNSFPETSPLGKLATELSKMPDVETMIRENTATKPVVTGRHWVSDPGVWNWIKSWFDKDDGHWVSDYKDVEFVNMAPIIDKFQNCIRELPIRNITLFKEQASKNVATAKEILLAQLDCIDAKLEENKGKLEKAKENNAQRQAEFDANEEKLTWLKNFNSQLDDVLAV